MAKTTRNRELSLTSSPDARFEAHEAQAKAWWHEQWRTNRRTEKEMYDMEKRIGKLEVGQGKLYAGVLLLAFLGGLGGALVAAFV